MKFKCSVDCINEYILGSISFFLKNIYLFIYLAALGLSDNLWDLFDCGTRDLVPWPGIELEPLALGAQS